MELNSNIIQFTGRAELDKPLEFAHDYDLMVRITCDDILKKNRNDGTFDFIYKVKPIGIVGIMDDKGVANVAKVKGSQSSRLRWEISKIDEYESIMEILLNHPEELCEWAIKIKNQYGK